MASQKKRRRGWRTYALLFCLTVFLVSGGLLVWAVLSFSSTGTFIYSNF